MATLHPEAEAAPRRDAAPRPHAVTSPASALNRARRQRIAQLVAGDYDGVATRAALREAGLTRSDIQVEVRAGRWHRLGRHTVGVTAQEPVGRAAWWRAVWESGPNAALDGTTALLAAGLTGWNEDAVDVSVPSSCQAHAVDGVVLHRPNAVGPVVGQPRRVKPELAVLRAAQWARTDRQAATLLAMTVQQRLAPPEHVLERWRDVLRAGRRAFLEQIIKDVCDGAQSLGELDFAAECRRRGLPPPSRQVVRTTKAGRVYLDVYWDDLRVHVEINGIQHERGLAPAHDALRRNEVTLRRDCSLVIPLLGLRLEPERFLDQVGQALEQARSAANDVTVAPTGRAPATRVSGAVPPGWGDPRQSGGAPQGCAAGRRAGATRQERYRVGRQTAVYDLVAALQPGPVDEPVVGQVDGHVQMARRHPAIDRIARHAIDGGPSTT